MTKSDKILKTVLDNLNQQRDSILAKKTLTKTDRAVLDAIEPSILLGTLNTPKVINKVTLKEFMSTSFIDDEGTERTLHDFLEDDCDVSFVFMEGLYTGGADCYLSFPDFDLSGYDVKSDFTPDKYMDSKNFLSYMSDILFTYGEDGRTTSMGGKSSGSEWLRIVSNNLVSEFFDDDLMKYFKNRHIEVEFTYDTNEDT